MNKFFYITGAAIAIILIAIFSITSFSNHSTGDEYYDRIMKKGEIILGVDPPYGAMEFIDEYGNYVGIDLDIAEEIAEELGVELKIVRVPWDNIFNELDAGDIDFIVNSVTITEERKKNFLFSRPYFDSGHMAIVKEDYVSLSGQGLDGRILGGEEGTTGLDRAYEIATDDSLVKVYPSEDVNNDVSGQYILDLRNGIIEAFITDYVHAVSIAWDIPSLKLLNRFLDREQYGIVLNKDAPVLTQKINEILDKMEADGRLYEIKKKWLGDSLVEFKEE